MKVEDVFKKVRVSVKKETQGEQVPWDASSLTGDFYFKPSEKQNELAALAEEKQRIEEELRHQKKNLPKLSKRKRKRKILLHLRRNQVPLLTKLAIPKISDAFASKMTRGQNILFSDSVSNFIKKV